MASPVTKFATLMVVLLYNAGLLLLQTSSVEALDIIGYKSTTACSGSAVGCYNVTSNVCCVFSPNVPSVRFQSLAKCQTGVLYKGKGCQTAIDSVSGPVNICFLNFGNISAGLWYTSCTADSDVSEESSETGGLSDAAAKACTSTALPNAVMYTAPGSTNGLWVLETGSDKVNDVLVQLESVPLDQKVGWLQGLGAHFRESLEQQSKGVDGSLV